jgi:molybdate transport system substrate-binding protein
MSTNRTPFLTLVLAALLWTTPIAWGAELIVSAAASLTNAFNEIGKAYEQAKPGTKVVFNFGSSGLLVQQIIKGAPVDVFASADEESMGQAQSRDQLLPKSRQNFARNTLVLAVPSGSNLQLKTLADLKDPAVQRIAVSNPDAVPVGRYSKMALEAAGLWSALEKRFIYTQNVRQSLDYLARKEVDAAFVYRTDVAVMPEKVTTAFDVPLKADILYPIAAIKKTRNEAVALDFIQFVLSEPGHKILAKYHFDKP